MGHREDFQRQQFGVIKSENAVYLNSTKVCKNIERWDVDACKPNIVNKDRDDG